MAIKGGYGDPRLNFKLGTYRMPFGKHANMRLIDLPSSYLDWFSKNGFPLGELGQLMRIVHDTRSAGLDHFLEAVRRTYPAAHSCPTKKY